MNVRNLLQSKVKIWMVFGGVVLMLCRVSLTEANATSRINPFQQEISLLEAIHRISERYQVLFNYDRAIVSDIQVQYEPKASHNVDDAITAVLENTDLKYQMFNERYVVIYKNDQEGIESLKEMIQHFQKIVDDKDKKVITMRQTRSVPRLTPRSLTKAIAPIAFSVEGRVTDQEGEPLIGVNIQVKGTNTGTATDFEGNFTLEDIDENAVLVVSYIGYQTQEVSIAGNSNLTITMVSDSQLLDEVVVVGYGTQKKTSLTSAVSSIEGKEIESLPITNLSNAIGGRLSGVVVKQPSGEPGRDGSNIYIRGISTTGSKSPLLIVDGVPRGFQNLDPNSIESFTVLKDAAAVAPYGIAGANGVILVTTKEGKSGDPIIRYNGYLGIQNPTIVPDFVNGYEFATLKNLAAANVGLPKQYSDDELQKFKDGSDPDRYPPYYDVWGSVGDKNPTINYHSFNVSGGSKGLNYYVNLGYQKQNGMWQTASANRYNYSINLKGEITSTTEIALKINSFIKKSFHPADDNGVFNGIKYAHPGRGPYEYSNGLSGLTKAIIFGSGYRNLSSTNTFSQISIRQKLPFWLSLKGTIAYDPIYSEHKLWSTPKLIGALDETVEPYKIKEVVLGTKTASLTQQTSKINRLTYQASLEFNNKFGNHDIGFIGVLEARSENGRHLGVSRRNYSLDIDEIDMGSSNSDDMTTSGSSSESSQIGLVYRLSYGFEEKYLFEASGRYDGHYYFAPDNRFGFFPAFSIGWRLSEENFIKDNFSWLHNFKIRASYGVVGALAGGPFQYLSSFGVRGPGYSIGGNGVQVVYERSEPNTNITWERANKTDIGLELSLWNGAINFEADYFYEKRSNMLITPDVVTPREYGIGLSQVNDGVMDNRGIEFLTGINYKISNKFSVGFNGTLTFAKNKVLEIYESGTTYDNHNRRRTGRPLGTPFGYQALGYFQAEDFDDEGNLNSGIAQQPWGKVFPGDLRYQDTNGDGKIDPNDRVPIGNPSTPGIIYGFSPNIEFKNISFQLLFQGASKVNQYLTQSATWAFYNARGAYKQNFDYWREDNLDARFPRITPVPVDNNTQTSSKWLYDTKYLRVKNITLSYNLPSKIAEKIRFENIQIYLSGQNIYTWAGYVGEFYDPENTNSGGYAYPQQKVYSMGLQITI